MNLEGHPYKEKIEAINNQIEEVVLKTNFNDEESKKKTRVELKRLIEERKNLYERGI